MANEMEKKYRHYEKMANTTIKNQHVQIYIVYGIIGILLGYIISVGRSVEFLLIAVVIGALLGVLAGFILIKIGKMRSKMMFGKLTELSKSEGYSDATLAEAYNIFEKFKNTGNKKLLAVNIATIHNIRGEFLQALGVLENIDETSFIADPSMAELYYAQKLLAMLNIGDLDHSADTYNRGLYYMRTYMNHPINGGIICNALAVYEFYCGHYDIALQLISDSDNIFNEFAKNGNLEISSLCEWFVNRYWQARILSMQGKTADALEALNIIGNKVYITDYYKTKIAELREELIR
ncbi:MAG: hypothetical protein K2H23_06625 [Oscillospiraceae bacterium]|nr:hypothetical protein [Oscillospiraceae bacterium]